MALHNFPEGLAIGSGFGASLKLGLSLAIAICLHDIPERYFYGSTNEAFAGGAMIYIVSGELIPEANKLYHGRMTAIGNMLGLLIGIFAMSI